MKIKIGNYQTESRINVISLLFVIAIICKLGNHSTWFSYCVLVVCLIEMMSINMKVLKKGVNVLASNKLIVLAFLISILTTLINAVVEHSFLINYFLELIVFAIITILGITVYLKRGKIYCIDGFRQISIIMTFLSVLGLFEYVSGKNFFAESGIMYSGYLGHGRVTSIFVNPMINGYCLMVALIITLCFFNSSKYKYISMLLLGVNLILTQTRSSWLGVFFIIFLIVMRWFMRNRSLIKRKTFIAVMIFVPIVVIISWKMSLFSLIYSRFSSISNYSITDYQRTGSIIYIFQAFNNSNIINILFGFGNHSVSKLMLSTTIAWQNFSTPDNLFLADLYNFGVVYSIITFIVLIRFTLNFFISKDWFKSGILEIVLSSAVCFFFLEPFNYYPITLLFFITFGIALAVLYKMKVD